MQTMTKTRKLIALIIPVLAVGGVWAVRGNAQDGRTSPAQRIAAPETWVPFTAELRQVKPKPNAAPQVIVGRFYRSAGGSQRLETWLENDPNRVIDIKNIPRALYFTTAREKATGRQYWVEQPLKLLPGGWKPIAMSERPPDRVLLKEPYDGREVVAVIVGPGMVNLMAPSLNFYPLVKTHIPSGERTEAHVISTEEPASELFEPPAGVEIRRSDKPSGIVFETREEAEAKGLLKPQP
jgi:hypothetical protein